MADQANLIDQVVTFTGCNYYQARTVLERSNWSVERAVNSFFDDPPPDRPPAGSTSQGSSNAVVPFQGPANQSNSSGWDVPNNPAYAPPSGPPPASGQGWAGNNKDVIDLTNDADTDEDLRRAMAASLQDHQPHQTSRPSAPSGSIGVSDAAETVEGIMVEEDDELMDAKDRVVDLTQNEEKQLQTDPDWKDPTASALLGQTRTLDTDTAGDTMTRKRGSEEWEPDDEVRRYGLRDRSKIKKAEQTPTILGQELNETSYRDRGIRTYGRRKGGRTGRGSRSKVDEEWSSWNTDIGMSEDEQLRQALEASVQSHHDSLQTTGSGARTPALPQHLDFSLQSRRVQGAPIAMVAPFPSLEIVAALLQALFAAPQVRTAYLASRPADARGTDLSNFWKGAAPTDSSSDSPNPALDAPMDLSRRIQTLFAFAALSQRPVCVVQDVTSLAPSEVFARGADHSAPAKVASLFYEFVVDSFTKHVSAVTEMILNTPGGEPVETDALWMTDALFLSSGAAALTSPASPRLNGEAEPALSPPKVEQQRSFIELRHDSVNSDTYSCLRAALASDGEGALLTRTAKVISMGVDHALPTADGGPPPFTIHERIHLDSLMWDRRQGVRLDAELRDLEMVRLDALRQDLEARKRKLLGDSGRSSAEVLLGAKRYFEQIATPNESNDAIRSASLAEAPPQIHKILEAVQADIAATDKLIARIRAQIDSKRALVADRAKREASNPEWTQLAYDLCAVLYQEAGHCVALVKQPNGTWWKICNGHATAVPLEDVVMGRPQDPSLGVFWIVYARVESTNLSTEEEEQAREQLIAEAMKAAIADDNLTYESELLSLIRSDAATPGSTVAEGVAGEVEEKNEDVAMANGDVEVPKSPRTS